MTLCHKVLFRRAKPRGQRVHPQRAGRSPSPLPQARRPGGCSVCPIACGSGGGRTRAAGLVSPTFAAILVAQNEKCPPAWVTGAAVCCELGGHPLQGQEREQGLGARTAPGLTLEVGEAGLQGGWGRQDPGGGSEQMSPPCLRTGEAGCPWAGLAPAPRTPAHALSCSPLLPFHSRPHSPGHLHL